MSELTRNFAHVGVISLFSNLLMLTGPVYMLQVYDRVLTGRSVETLLALTVLAVGLYFLLSILDAVRARMMARISALVEARFSVKAFQANAMQAASVGERHDKNDPVRDLDRCRNFLAGPAPIALFDLPWLPIYLAIVFVIHPWLALLAAAGALCLLVLLLLSEMVCQQPIQKASALAQSRSIFSSAARTSPAAVIGLRMISPLSKVWAKRTEELLEHHVKAADRSGTFAAASKGLRLFLQSAILGLGAYLAIKEQISPGMMIASSIIVARALAPLDQTISSWRSLAATRQARQRLSKSFANLPSSDAKDLLPPPSAEVTVDRLISGPSPSQVVLKGIGFTLKAGDGLGMIGESGSGKTSLGRAMLGMWPAFSGSVRFDGATLDQWDLETIGSATGYLPQDVQLFEGTIADNISRFISDPPLDEIVSAARKAGIHDMIVALPKGYATQIGEGSLDLSSGQKQRLGLARALYGDPFFVVLDEPNANLDAKADALLADAISGVRQRGGIVVVIAHRPSALSTVEKLLFLKEGKQLAFGEKHEVLQKITKASDPLNATTGLKVIANDRL
ncbi:MAG: type I secretion system permease/ATPase [Pseudomonadota bacterium]